MTQTKRRTVRLSDEMWEMLGEVATDLHSDRSEALRQIIVMAHVNRKKLAYHVRFAQVIKDFMQIGKAPTRCK